MTENDAMQGSLAPEATVGGLIFNEKGELFMMQSPKWRGLYCIPGGHVELGESLRDAVCREIKEETNLDVSHVTFHSIQDCIFSDKFHVKRHFIFVDFICTADSDKVRLNDEGTEYTWVNLHEISRYPVEPYTLKTIEYYLSNRHGPAYIE